MEDLKSWRAARRGELLAARQAMPAAQRAQWNEALCTHLRDMLPAVRGVVIGAYMPFRGEPDLRALLEVWRQAGAEIALPVMKGRGMAMEFRAWWPGCAVVQGPLSLPMPDGTPLLTPRLLLMPPVGFDEGAFRLGYGGGYFDHTLAAMTPAPIKIGVAFELSRIASITPQHYDVPMDFVVTELGVYERRDAQLKRLQSANVASQALAALRALRYAGDAAQDSSASPPCYAAEFDPPP